MNNAGTISYILKKYLDTAGLNECQRMWVEYISIKDVTDLDLNYDTFELYICEAAKKSSVRKMIKELQKKPITTREDILEAYRFALESVKHE